MKVVLTIAGLAPEFGGPSRSVPALAEALARENVDVDLVTCESLPNQHSPVLPDSRLIKTRLLPVYSRMGRWRARGNDFFTALREIARSEDTVIHDNGLWLPTNHAVASAARFLKRPLLISPRGMLGAWERRHHGWTKHIAWMLFQRRDLRAATLLHATSEEEALDFRKAGYCKEIAVVPNAIDLPAEYNRDARKGNERIALCVTRLHRKKGLFNLVEAWFQARPKGWRMVIAGGDEDGHRVELEKAIARHSLTSVFEFVGPVDGDQKNTLYNRADLFVLPSHSENFGMSIAEALAHGLPVITTHGTPWKDLVDHNCGWWVEVGAEPLAQVLAQATSLDNQTRRQMGERGLQLVKEKYSWSRVAKEMKSVYEWLLGRGEQPPCVQAN